MERVVPLERYTLTAGFENYGVPDHSEDWLKIVDSCACYAANPTMVALQGPEIKALFDFLTALHEEGLV